ncbi:MAG: hypothetical protein QOJ26_1137 [Thermoplasmata archaeon]|nr:hypothetical protein [Thermoplasmata archaeon]MEA3166265.1 hypothetical protein [Thermoplasmata archaeon]
MPATVERYTLEAAREEAATRLVRLDAVVAPLWRAARQWTTALVLALFPFLFILDEAVELPLSPVLPGLVVLALLLVGLPFLLVEWRSRRYRGKDADWQARRAAKAARNSRSAMVLALVWLVVWFAVGT